MSDPSSFFPSMTSAPSTSTPPTRDTSENIEQDDAPRLRGRHPSAAPSPPPGHDPFRTAPQAIRSAFSSMRDEPTPKPSDQEAQLQAAFPSMAPTERSSTPTSDTPRTEPAVSRAPEPAADVGSPTTLRLEDVGEIALPPGLAVDTAALEEFTSIAAEHHFDGATAQKMIDLHSAALERTVDAAERQITEDWAKVTRGWADAVKADPEIGGANFNVATRLAKAMLDKHPGFKAAVKELGIGNHPELIRFLYRAEIREGADKMPWPLPKPRR